MSLEVSCRSGGRRSYDGGSSSCSPRWLLFSPLPAAEAEEPCKESDARSLRGGGGELGN
jgi:hypothetical protein